MGVRKPRPDAMKAYPDTMNTIRTRPRHPSSPFSSPLQRFETAAPALILFLGLAGIRILSAYVEAADYLYVALCMAIAGAAVFYRKREWGLSRPNSWGRVCLFVLLLVGVYMAEAEGLRRLVSDPDDNWMSAFHALMRTSFPFQGLGWFLLASSAALILYAAEEFYFRGLLFTALAKRFSAPFTVLATAAVWSVLHLGSYGLAPFNPQEIGGMIPCVFLMGVCLGAARLATGSAITSFLCQAIGNLALNFWTLYAFGFPA